MVSNNLAVLNAMDDAATQKYHFVVLGITGMGFFATTYNFFCINAITKLLGRIYFYDPLLKQPGRLPQYVNNLVNGAALTGTFCGQLYFGWLGDRIGRKKAYGMTLIIIFLSALFSGSPFGSPVSVIAILCFFRFWLGVALGGTYPLCATIMSEYANRKTRGAFLSGLFTMQGFGIIFSGLVPMVLSKIFLIYYDAKPFYQYPAHSAQPQGNILWRIVLMVGALPAAITYCWLRKLPETARYTAVIKPDPKNDAARDAVSDMRRVLTIHVHEDPDEEHKISKFKAVNSYPLWSIPFFEFHGIHLIGAMCSWCLLDIAFYSQNLTQKDLFPDMGLTKNPTKVNAIEEVYQQSRAMFIAAFLGTFPGYLGTVFLIDKFGRLAIQLMGFLMMSAFMLIMGVKYDYIRDQNHALFVVLYSLTFFFANFGPNSTTFIMSAELFPMRMRCLCHGLSAAAGKLGAMVGTFVVQTYTLKQGHDRTKHSLMVLAFTNMLGFCFTFFMTETKGLSLEELSGEDGGENEIEVDEPLMTNMRTCGSESEDS
ncbi:hypothetical protein K2173_023496 [Erythroxylum novogranatense]|uniref:Major facilitator superfamily (MFS) profile domain-containing protein n=1 Tax=Erythroxylum novogranatense TaxID=1862640 RepID=A0AAV8S7Q3_9ROSI|nr:hypothetical protein K2173_023496 [Erythroxylum novogranatense]